MMFNGLFRVYCFICGIALTLLLGLLLTAGYWLEPKEQPRKAQAIVVLGGSYTRPPYAAELYAQGLAPKIYVGRMSRLAGERVTDSLNLPNPRMEELYRSILLAKGVPDSDIVYYGENILSTAQEAEALRQVLPGLSGQLLLVTSAYHARRAKAVFSEAFPGWSVQAVSTPLEPLASNWWQDKESASKVLLEAPKALFYLLGGKFHSLGQ